MRPKLPRAMRETYLSNFKFPYDFGKNRDFYLSNKQYLNLMVQLLITREITKKTFFKGIPKDFKIRDVDWYPDSDLLEEKLQVYKLVQSLYIGRIKPYAIVDLLKYAHRVGIDIFKYTEGLGDNVTFDNIKIMESCLHKLSESGMVEISNYEYPNGVSYQYIRPSVALKTIRASKSNIRVANRLKTASDNVKQGKVPIWKK